MDLNKIVDELIAAHSMGGMAELGWVAKEKPEYAKICELVIQYIGKNFPVSASTSCFPGKLEWGNHPERIKQYVQEAA